MEAKQAKQVVGSAGMGHSSRGKRLSLAAGLLLLAGLSFGFSAAKMALPPGLSGSQVVPVQGRQKPTFKQSFTFGAYQAKDVRRGWTVTTNWNVFNYSSGKAKQTFEFNLLRGGKPLYNVMAATGVELKVLEKFLNTPLDLALKDQTTFAVTFTAPGKAPSADSITLGMHGSVDGMMNGVLTFSGKRLEVESTNKLEGTRIGISEASGYIFKRDGKPVAAVEVMNAGRLFFASGLDAAEKDVISGAASALLLYQALDPGNN